MYWGVFTVSIIAHYEGIMCPNFSKFVEKSCAVAEDPCMKDIGILISLDPIAIDQACIDLVYAATDDPGQGHLLKRIESRNGVLTIEAAAELGYGSREYELVEV